jgi:Tol biopolymer transport system component
LERGQLVWIDQRGNELGPVGSPGDYEYQSVRLSPRGDALLVARRQPGLGTLDIFRIDLIRQTEERLTTDRGVEVTPVWIDNGQAIVFAADRGGIVPYLFRKDLVSGVEQPLLPPGMQQLAMDVFPDQKAVAFLHRQAHGGFDIFRLALTADASPTPLVQSRLDKSDMRLSPDGKAMSFSASDGTRMDLYLAPVPVTTPPVLAASDIGGVARWSADGRRVYYQGPGRVLMSLPIRTSPVLTVGTPQPLFEVRQPFAALFDVAPDGRFLFLVRQQRASQIPIAVTIDAVAGAVP